MNRLQHVSVPASVALCALIVASCAPFAVAQESNPFGAGRFYEQEPYDLVVLNDEAKTEWRIFPLAEPPKDPRPNDKFLMRRIEAPDEELEVPWYTIASYKTFGQLVLEHARSQVVAGDYLQAYDTFRHLRQYYPTLDGVEAGLTEALLSEARHCAQNNDADQALAAAYSVYDRDKAAPGLEELLASVMKGRIAAYMSDGDYVAARACQAEYARRYPDADSTVELAGLFTLEADRLAQSAASLSAAGKHSPAQDEALAALVVWPKHAKARELLADLHAKRPRVVVGVSSPSRPKIDGLSAVWGSGRDDRLTGRQLMEFVGYSADGGKYACSVGELSLANLGRRIDLRVVEGLGGADSARRLTGLEVARRLVELARPDSPDFEPQWGELFGAVEAQDPFEISVDLTRAHVQPAALLTTSPFAARSDPSALAPFVPDETSSGDARLLVANSAYVDAQSGQPQMIVERLYASADDAVEALRDGWVAIVDRIPPWRVAELQGDANLRVKAYAAPTIHCLLPNLNKPLAGDRTFRRALTYGINRESILQQKLLRGGPAAGCYVASGPFARGESLSDAMGYAFDDRLDPRPYDPRLALTLIDVARLTQAGSKRQAAAADETVTATAGDGAGADAQSATAAGDAEELPPLVLAYPASDVARVACESIKKHWELLGLEVVLREIPPDAETLMLPDDDFLYAELTMAEPLVDARRLLGPDGLMGSCSPYMSVALRGVDEATSWADARTALQRVHRVAVDDTAVIPLWQLRERLAYHASLSGVPDVPAELYQNVESWRTELRILGTN